MGLAATLLVGLALLVAGPLRAQERAPQVRDITVQGNRRIQAAVILGRIQTRIGDTFAPAAVREDVRNVFALGFFEDVQVRVEEFEGGVRLIFVVAERPLLREVAFEGHRDLKTEELRERAGLRAGTVYNPAEIQRAEEAIRQRYEEEGYFGVTIAPRTELTPEGDLRVVFRIQEGRKLYIDRIVIEGNQALTARQIKGVMETQERVFWLFPFAKVQRRVFEDDQERILALYADQGYIQARIEAQEILPDVERGRITLRVRVVEGPQFRVGALTVRGHQVLPESELRRLAGLREGDVFNRSRLRAGVRAISERYSELGRARAEVVPSTEVDAEGRRVHVTLTVNEGPEVYVERIHISGNIRSSEKVLRRELRLVEGELFTIQKLVRSRQRLFNLGYFDAVNVSVDPGSAPDRVVVNIQVQERATGIFSIGAGFSSLDGLFGVLDVTQRNLFGRGQEVFLRVRVGARSQLGLLGFTEPYLFDLPLRAGFDVYDREREFDDFTEERIGGDLRAAYPLGEFVTASAVYRLEDVEVRDLSSDASEALRREAGRRLNSVLELALARDTRDSIFEPTRGSRHALGVDVAGLGGDTRFYRIVGESAWFFPLPVSDWVLGVRGLAGVVRGWGGKEVPLFERFFLGGATTLRGQRTRSVGPRDATGNVIGGTEELLFNVELLIPVIPRLRLVLFFDAGNAYGFGQDFDPTDLRYGAGAGIRFFSPLGPLRLDWGYNLDRKAGEKAYQIHFTVGATF